MVLRQTAIKPHYSAISFKLMVLYVNYVLLCRSTILNDSPSCTNCTNAQMLDDFFLVLQTLSIVYRITKSAISRQSRFCSRFDF